MMNASRQLTLQELLELLQAKKKSVELEREDVIAESASGALASACKSYLKGLVKGIVEIHGVEKINFLIVGQSNSEKSGIELTALTPGELISGKDISSFTKDYRTFHQELLPLIAAQPVIWDDASLPSYDPDEGSTK